VLVTHAFLRSLATLDLAESRVRRLSPQPDPQQPDPEQPETQRQPEPEQPEPEQPEPEQPEPEPVSRSARP
jgi:hypothetical protein